VLYPSNIATTNNGIPMLTSTSNNFYDFMTKLKKVLLAKGLWHVCYLTAAVISRPIVKIEKGASQLPGYIAPTEKLQEALEFNAEALQNHEVVLLLSNSREFSLHHLLEPYPEPPPNVLGRMVYHQIDNHFRQSNEWTKQEILSIWESIGLTNPRDTYNTITRTFYEAISAGVIITQYSAAVKFARLIQPLHPAYIPILQDVMRNPDATLDSICPTVVSTGTLLRLTAPPRQPEHAHNAPAYTPRIFMSSLSKTLPLCLLNINSNLMLS
jgi:hypothetical protein